MEADLGINYSSFFLLVSDSLESIEREYVLVHEYFASVGTLFSSPEASHRENSRAELLTYTQQSSGIATASLMQSGELVISAVCGAESVGSQMSTSTSVLRASIASEDVAGPSSVNLSSRLKSMYQYVYVLTELAQEKVFFIRPATCLDSDRIVTNMITRFMPFSLSYTCIIICNSMDILMHANYTNHTLR